MKYVSILLFTILAFCSCQKEDALENEIDFSNPYAIEDSDDPIQKKRFEIFNKYGVPVYFNDTIGRQFVRNDINGNPYYRYETGTAKRIFECCRGFFRIFSSRHVSNHDFTRRLCHCL